MLDIVNGRSYQRHTEERGIRGGPLSSPNHARQLTLCATWQLTAQRRERDDGKLTEALAWEQKGVPYPPERKR